VTPTPTPGEPLVEPAGPVVVAVDRRTARVLQALAVTGVVVSLVVAIVAWRFVGDLERDVDQSLRIGEDAAETLSDTIDLAVAVLDAVDSGIVTLDTALDAVEAGVADAGEVADATVVLSTTIADSLDDVDRSLAQVESLAATIDDALRSLSQIPLGPDYDPSTSYPDAIAGLRAALDPLDDDIRDLAVRLESVVESTDALGPSFADLDVELDTARTTLADGDRLLDRYRISAEEAGALAERSRDELGTSMWWARAAIVLLAAWLVAAQYVPWWLAGRVAPLRVRRGRPVRQPGR
jgi:hypothetical protein